ncbi:hypothetical protein IE53DRAFT_252447 [Violaceomyces palustris]|uniref:Uncharacterized protein n=1 Tax=Violaceomyces palustris TaxID=1673888 RepID=A0ACD0NNL9_9BASI|nr:hypothetical protein IE53DRAFT_252447 [Violaceomyces palustris]
MSEWWSLDQGEIGIRALRRTFTWGRGGLRRSPPLCPSLSLSLSLSLCPSVPRDPIGETNLPPPRLPKLANSSDSCPSSTPPRGLGGEEGGGGKGERGIECLKREGGKPSLLRLWSAVQFVTNGDQRIQTPPSHFGLGIRAEGEAGLAP